MEGLGEPIAKIGIKISRKLLENGVKEIIYKAEGG